MQKSNSKRKIKRPSEPRIKPKDYSTAPKEWKLKWFGFFKLVLQNPAAKKNMENLDEKR